MGKNKSAVYAGTFDPLTNGHRDIIIRAAGIFDSLVVAVAEDSRKDTLFTPEERMELISETIKEFLPADRKRIKVAAFQGLLVDYVKKLNSNVIIRGLRAVSDYEYESQMAVINRNLDNQIETVFLMTAEENSFISSSVVREIAKLGGDVSSLVPKSVNKRVKKKVSLKQAK